MFLCGSWCLAEPLVSTVTAETLPQHLPLCWIGDWGQRLLQAISRPWINYGNYRLLSVRCWRPNTFQALSHYCKILGPIQVNDILKWLMNKEDFWLHCPEFAFVMLMEVELQQNTHMRASWCCKLKADASQSIPLVATPESVWVWRISTCGHTCDFSGLSDGIRRWHGSRWN